VYSGNHSAAFGGQLTFDVLTTFADPKPTAPDRTIWIEPPLVILRSRQDSLATDLAAPIKCDQWNSMSIPLNAAGKWYRLSENRALEGLQTDRVPVSEETIRAVLSNLDSIWIRAEYLHGYDIGRLDNVMLLAPNRPASMQQQDTKADASVESAKSGERVPGATPRTSPITGAK
jgi:hypothetical protein